MYRLTVEKFVEPKKLTSEEVERIKREPFMGVLGQAVTRTGTYEDYLMIKLTDEEFAAVKKAVLGVM